VVLRLRGW